MKAGYLIPPAVFIAMLGFLGVGLKLNPREVPSPLIDKAGIIRYRQIGPITPEVLRSTILRLVQKLNAA